MSVHADAIARNHHLIVNHPDLVGSVHRHGRGNLQHVQEGVSTLHPSHAPSGTGKPTSTSRPASRFMRGGLYRMFATLIVVSLATGGLLLAPPESASASYTAAVRDYVNLRAEPNPDSEIVTVVNPGTQVQVVGEPQGGYVEVIADGVSGYISGEFLADVAEDPLRDYFGTGYDDNTRWVIGIGALNLRAEPNASSDVLQVLPEGTQLTLTREAIGPFAGVVAADGTVGWVAPNNLTPNLPDTVTPINEPGTVPDPGAPQLPVDPQPPVESEPPVDPAPPADPEPPVTPDPPDVPEPPVDSGDPGAPESVPVGDDVTGSASVIGGSLNLRAGPGDDFGVVSILPVDATVELRGEGQNEFLPVSYSGQTGWALADFLAVDADADPGDPPVQPDPDEPAPDPGPDPVDSVPVGDEVTGSATTTAALNMRQGPGLSFDVVTVIPASTTVDIRGEAQDGFVPVATNGQTGWSSADWLNVGDEGSTPPAPEEPAPAPSDPDPAPPPGDVVTGQLVTTAAVNHRSAPSANASIINVLPPSTSVDVLGDPQNGFFPVRFGGNDGWASGDFLVSPDSVPAPPESDGGGIVDIIYAAADAYGQPRADMLRVAQCESNLDPSAVNASSGASGLFQFMPGTWLTTPFADQDIFDPVANANAAGWMWENGRRNEWVCQ